MNGVAYTVDGNGRVVLADWDTDRQDEMWEDGEIPNVLENQYVQEMDGNRFKVNGIWYVIEENEIKYAKAEVSKLRKIYVGNDNMADYPERGVQFNFDNSWNSVVPVRRYSTNIQDRVVDEWCEFDNSNPMTLDDFDKDRTFEWYLANEIVRIGQKYGKTI